mmetsp:Transcript_52073/g.121467  ORF Transcript_52073/g.121467 Transcript_52073/m.121467 type:complete len:309 (+) Transcript_52073:95-1021(+)
MAEGTSPYLFLFYRCFFGSVLMILTMGFVPALRSSAEVPYNAVSELAQSLKSDGEKFFLLACLIGLNTFGGIMAVARLPAIVCAIFQPTTPIIAAAMSTVLGVEPWSLQSWGKILCIAACVAGAGIVVGFGHGLPLHRSHSDAAGWLFLALNVAGGAAYNVFQKKIGVLQKYSPTFVAAVSFLIAACGLLPAACYSATTSRDASLAGHPISQVALIYGVVLATAYNYSMTAWANRATEPTTVVAFHTLQPVATCILNYLVYGVHLTTPQALGGLAIIAGLLANIGLQTEEAKDADERRPLKGMTILVK